MSRKTTSLTRCEKCGELLNESRIVWLELDTRDHSYTSQPVPEEFSQGGFPFGKACAKAADGTPMAKWGSHNRKGKKRA